MSKQGSFRRDGAASGRHGGARRAGLAFAILLAAPSLVGCSTQAAPLPQLVVVLDTDMPVVDRIRTQDLSNDAAMDSVRVDALDATGHTFDLLDVTVPDPLDWPVSFGVATDDARTIRLRARLFRAQYASAGEQNGQQTLDPTPAITIDRVVDIPLPESGITTVEIVFAGDCLGVLPVFGASATNCVDAAHPAAPSTEGLIALPDANVPQSRRVGTWAPAAAVDCAKPGDDQHICIRGGFTLLGDTGLDGLADGVEIRVDAAPMRPVILSPFYLDKTEVTVGQFDALRAAMPGAITGTLPTANDPSTTATQYCTWLGGKGGHENLPLNCVDRKTAAQICKARGGKLPSEAQWEHAARGRGRHLDYPWGSASPSCCIASLARYGNGCPGLGPEPVGSHPKRASCGGLGDVSVDGVLDLGGSVSEYTLDALARYTDKCWQGVPVPRDPVCVEAGTTAFIRRGAAWNDLSWGALAAIRETDLAGEALDSDGVRCAYPNGAP